jgi:hypothetical protein
MKSLSKELTALVTARGSTLLQLHGIGPSGATRLLADAGDIHRFADRDKFAFWNGTAPLDASSGSQERHRLSRAGCRWPACARLQSRAYRGRGVRNSCERPGADFVMCVSGPVSEQLAELQLTLGQGPGHDVLASATPPLADDIDDEEPGRQWPAFTAESGKLGARAVFAFPLAIGVRHQAHQFRPVHRRHPHGRQLLPRPRQAPR